MQVQNFLENSAKRFPEKPAVLYKNKWITYLEIEKRSNQLANFLIEKGIKKGDRVAILWENSFEYVIAYYGILKAGGVTVELNTELTTDDLIYMINDSEARGLIAQFKFNKLYEKNFNQLSSVQFVVVDKIEINSKNKIVIDWNEIEESYSTQNPNIRAIDLDLASIVYTSGSTGKSKGVMLSHLNIITNTKSIVEYLKLKEEDRILVILPFFYVYGKSLLNTHFFVGGSVVIDNRFTFPNIILETLKDTKCTGFAGVPSTFTILLNKSSLKKYKFPHLRYVTQAGGGMAPTIQKEVALAFYPAQLFIMYGATEASARLSYLDPCDLSRKWGSIGKAIPNVELFIADKDGKPIPPGQTGEIVARGANIMQGYWKDPEETKKVLRNGLYFTGDLGVMDDEGFLYVVGRSKDMIKVGANRVSAKQIEEKLIEHPDIYEIAVIGVEDEILGEAIKAFVVPKPGKNYLTIEVIMNFAKQKLPSFMVPKYIEIVESLPKSAAGKILKSKLK